MFIQSAELVKDMFIGMDLIMLKVARIRRSAVAGGNSVVATEPPAFCVEAGQTTRSKFSLKIQFPDIENSHSHAALLQ